jgi:sugar phosphate isomerase/epimerase
MKEIAAIGYKGVQVSGLGPIDPNEIREVCDANGLTIVCTHVPYDDLKDHTGDIIQKHQIFGCRYPGLGSMPGKFYDSGLDSLREFIREINGIAAKLANADMRLLYHNHSHEFQRFDGKLAMDVLIEECSPDIEFELDVYWIQCGGGNPVKWLRGRSSDIIHFKDMIGTKENKNDITTVGKGNLDWREIIQACRDTRVRWAMVEQDNAVDAPEPIRCMADAFEFLVQMGCRP